MVNTIHILGAGNIGCHLAFALRNLRPHPPQVTLLLRKNTIPTFKGKIICTHKGVTKNVEGVEAEESEGRDKGWIENLVIATKTYQLLSALQPLRERLDARSTVLLMMNGIPPPTATLFPDPESRPRCLSAVTTHGIFSTERFCITLAGVGELHFGPSSELAGWFEEQLQRTGGIMVTGEELRRRQVEKLTVNAAINPVSALWGVKNGETMGIPEAVGVMRGVVKEVAEVEELDETQLWRKVEEVAKMTKDNWSSMCQDLRAGRRTEVEEINGWVVNRAKEMGKKCKVNEALIERVREGEKMRGR